ncbi:hypothetical protein PMZ80_000142 [Knufia obscura]|uniref:Ribosome quality control complex subunit 2 n=2 Tax=Knufia TaxID=430999 RepID=A0AAN8IBE0_9EURO|nr:hypothetical protein PMZ80_000142 [Knufia obscura]KAK5956930.1 hypothetical protein OHC33_002419 [Knufia fluminis]
MKQRFSSLDVKVIAAELNSSLTGLRVSNIYDLSSRIFLFKCARPGSKEQLLVDSGFRAHLTSFSRTAASAPSQFVTRLRKYLKSQRITGVRQIGTDRVIEIVFRDGFYRLFLEFFAAGNIILADAELNVLALLRQVNEGDPAVDVKLGSKYMLEPKQNYNGVPPVTTERITTTLKTQAEKFKSAQESGGKKAKRNKGGDDLRKALSIGFPEFPPHLLEHVFTNAGLDVGTKLEDVLGSEELLAKVEKAMNEAGDISHSLDSSSQEGSPRKSYIIAKVKENKDDAQPHDDSAETSDQQSGKDNRSNLLYDDFHPFLPSQFANKPNTKILEIEGFNKTVDEFYSSLESQKLESRLTEREEAAKKKLESAKNEHDKRLEGLQKVQELHIRKAQAIEANTHRVEEACGAVNGLVGQGMDWMDIGKLIENEQKRGNVVAQVIKLPLKLYENTVTLLLDEPGAVDEDSDDEADLTEEEEDSEDESVKAKKPVEQEKRLSIDIDLALSPYANARQYYEQKKSAAQKETKTIAASERALKSMEKKTQTDLKKALKSETQTLRATRKAFWFEKFLYFISSDGYLVLGGKDAQQNEILYRRYLKKGDIFVHADLHGASCVIIKNNPQTPDAPIPPSTLSQAGQLSVCSSSAWDSKAVMAAWWVNSDQVSKTAPTGEYLTTGGFMVRGQKNFLPPSQLLLGFGIYWLISEGSRANHGKNRIQRTDSMMTGEAEMLAEDARGLSLDDNQDDEQETDDVVPDVEDAGDKAEEEVEEDNEAVDGDHDDDGSDTEDDHDEEDEDRKQQSNPLQMNGDNSQHDQPEREVEIEDADPKPPQAEEQAEAEDTNPDTAGETADETDDQAGSTTAATGTGTGNVSETESSLSGPQVGTMKPLHPPTTSKPTQKQKPTPTKRGANTKAAKRRAAKYALQDEEDKALAMQLLGTTKDQQRKAAEEEAKLVRERKNEADRERRRAQHNKAAEAEKARQEKLARSQANNNETGEGGAVEEEDDEQSAEQAAIERAEHSNIDLLVSEPVPGDELIAAIPVCAPWSALSKNKYKVKLQPGSLKKGKALKEIVGIWAGLGSKGAKVVDEKNADKERVWAREVELVKGWRVEEIVGVVPVRGVRIVMGGGAGANNALSKGKGGSRGGKGKKR